MVASVVREKSILLVSFSEERPFVFDERFVHQFLSEQRSDKMHRLSAARRAEISESHFSGDIGIPFICNLRNWNIEDFALLKIFSLEYTNSFVAI